MATSIFEQWPQTGKLSLEPMFEFGNITMRLCGDITRENMKAFSELLQTNTEQMQNLSQVKGMDDVFSAQARWAAKTTPQVYQHMQHIMDMILESTSECSKLLEKGIQQCAKEASKGFAENKHCSGKKGDH